MSIYGAWIDKKGNMFTVPEEEHFNFAIEKVLKRLPKYQPVYKIMYRLGYIRIVFTKTCWNVEYIEKYGYSKKQADWIKNAESIGTYNY
jgi:hypothetical protein